jgi:hypothetical protein
LQPIHRAFDHAVLALEVAAEVHRELDVLFVVKTAQDNQPMVEFADENIFSCPINASDDQSHSAKCTSNDDRRTSVARTWFPALHQ